MAWLRCYQAGTSRTCSGTALFFGGIRYSRAKAAAAAAVSAAPLIRPITPPYRRAAPLATVMARSRSKPLAKPGWSRSSDTGNTCLQISVVMRNTRKS